jgi:hypothetical protein
MTLTDKEQYTGIPVHDESPDSPTLPMDQEIAEYEEAATEMLERMDSMLDTVKGVNKVKDPSRRLEVITYQLCFTLT